MQGKSILLSVVHKSIYDVYNRYLFWVEAVLEYDH